MEVSLDNSRIEALTEQVKNKSVPLKHKSKKSANNKLKLYHVIWRDAFSEEDVWHDETSLGNQDYICETVGFLIEKNSKPNYITIASTVTHEGMFCSIMNIPKAMIVSKTLLTIKD